MLCSNISHIIQRFNLKNHQRAKICLQICVWVRVCVLEHFRWWQAALQIWPPNKCGFISAAIYRKFDLLQWFKKPARDETRVGGLLVFRQNSCVFAFRPLNLLNLLQQRTYTASCTAFHFRNGILDAEMMLMFLSVMKNASRHQKEQHCREHARTYTFKNSNCYVYEWCESS